MKLRKSQALSTLEKIQHLATCEKFLQKIVKYRKSQALRNLGKIQHIATCKTFLKKINES